MHINPKLTINPKPSSDRDHSDEYATAFSISDINILRESNLELDLRSLEIYLICKHKLKLNAKKKLCSPTQYSSMSRQCVISEINIRDDTIRCCNI